MARILSSKSMITLIVMLIFLFFNSCISLIPIKYQTHTATKFLDTQEGFNTHELFTKGQIAFLIIEENEFSCSHLAIDGIKINPPNILRNRRWIITILPGEHSIDFGVDIYIDKKGKYYSSIKKLTSSFTAEGGVAYKLVTKQKSHFYFKQDIVKTLSSDIFDSNS